MVKEALLKMGIWKMIKHSQEDMTSKSTDLFMVFTDSIGSLDNDKVYMPKLILKPEYYMLFENQCFLMQGLYSLNLFVIIDMKKKRHLNFNCWIYEILATRNYEQKRDCRAILVTLLSILQYICDSCQWNNGCSSRKRQYIALSISLIQKRSDKNRESDFQRLIITQEWNGH